MTTDVYEGKYFSVLEDSISTLDGYNPPGYAVFYGADQKFKSNILSSNDTWWGQVISKLGGKLLVNNSFSGSLVCRHPYCEIPSYACSDERTSALGKADIFPDIVMIFMGINDWGWGIKIFPDNEKEKGTLSAFSVAYDVMLTKIRANYPNAEIWCFTLPISRCSRIDGFTYPYRYAERHIEDYCNAIADSAKKFGCRLIDLYHLPEHYDTIDGFYPTDYGIKTISGGVLGEILKIEEE